MSASLESNARHPRPPLWASASVARADPEISSLSAAFAAGAALATLDVVVRDEAPFACAWRARLALKAAAASLEGLGGNVGFRPGDEAGLRDALALTRPGGDPGPAGRVYRAWRARRRRRAKTSGPPRRLRRAGERSGRRFRRA